MNESKVDSSVDMPAIFASPYAHILGEAYLNLNRQIENINRKWFDRLGETYDSKVSLSKELLYCANAIEAAEICRYWLYRRSAMFAGDMQDFGQSWLEFSTRLTIENVAQGRT